MITLCLNCPVTTCNFCPVILDDEPFILDLCKNCGTLVSKRPEEVWRHEFRFYELHCRKAEPEERIDAPDNFQPPLFTD